MLLLLLIRFVYTKSFKAISTHWNAHIWANAFWFSICCSNPFKLNDDDFRAREKVKKESHSKHMSDDIWMIVSFYATKFRARNHWQLHPANQTNVIKLGVCPTNRVHVDIFRNHLKMMTQMENYCISRRVHLDTHIDCSYACCKQSFNLVDIYFFLLFFRMGKKALFSLVIARDMKKK